MSLTMQSMSTEEACQQQSRRSLADEPCNSPQYGYIQIDNYAQKERMKKATATKPGPKRWVELPRNTMVHSHPRWDAIGDKQEPQDNREIAKDNHSTSNLAEAHSRKPLAQPLHPSLHTLAKVERIGNVRCVRFIDGLAPGCTATSNAPLAEWIFIDRDICGVSLYQYAPDDAEYGDFASSSYGHDFRKELKQIGIVNKREQRAAMTDETYLARYYAEEEELHEALQLAGVAESFLTHEVEVVVAPSV